MAWYNDWNDFSNMAGQEYDGVSEWVDSLISPYEAVPVSNASDLDSVQNALKGVGTVDTANGIANGKTNTVGATKSPSRSLSSGVMQALQMAGGHGRNLGGQAHAASSAFHYQSPMNPNQVLQNTVNDIRDTSNPLNVFKALNNEF